jgi:hypothetical protein
VPDSPALPPAGRKIRLTMRKLAAPGTAASVLEAHSTAAAARIGVVAAVL